jgi:uncharacterized protein (UPF0548 family)
MHVMLARVRPGADPCARWRLRAPTSTREGMPTWRHDRYEAEVVRPANETPEAAFERVWTKVAHYRIFPDALLWAAICPPGEVTKGAVIVQRFRVWRVTLECAVRVIDRWDERTGHTRRAGFRYVTLAGHPERGVESFEVRSDATGRITVMIDARSRAGTLLTWLGHPFARRVQVTATERALLALTGGTTDGPPLRA